MSLTLDSRGMMGGTRGLQLMIDVRPVLASGPRESGESNIA